MIRSFGSIRGQEGETIGSLDQSIIQYNYNGGFVEQEGKREVVRVTVTGISPGVVQREPNDVMRKKREGEK